MKINDGLRQLLMAYFPQWGDALTVDDGGEDLYVVSHVPAMYSEDEYNSVVMILRGAGIKVAGSTIYRTLTIAPFDDIVDAIINDTLELPSVKDYVVERVKELLDDTTLIGFAEERHAQDEFVLGLEAMLDRYPALAFDALVELYDEDTYGDDVLSQHIIPVVGYVDDEDTLKQRQQWLWQYVNHNESYVRYQAYYALAVMDDVSFLPELEKAMEREKNKTVKTWMNKVMVDLQQYGEKNK